MYGLLNILYDKEKISSIEQLYNDCSAEDQFLIRATIAKALKDSPAILDDNGTDWILCTLAQHGKSPDDTVRVFQSIIRHLFHFHFGILDENIQFKNPDSIADSCLVGIGFFRERMERMYKRYAAPSVEYYEEAGRLAFIRIGYEQIGEDFKQWTDFIEKEFVDI